MLVPSTQAGRQLFVSFAHGVKGDVLTYIPMTLATPPVPTGTPISFNPLEPTAGDSAGAALAAGLGAVLAGTPSVSLKSLVNAHIAAKGY